MFFDGGITRGLPLLLTLFAVVWVCVWLEGHTRVGRKLGAAATTILIGLALSNIGVLPGTSPVYDLITGPVVLAGIVLILLSVNLDSIRRAGAPMLIAFLVGAVGSGLGAMIMGTVLADQIGPEAWKLSGQFAATYIGGGANYAAVGRELETSSDLYSAGVAADVIVTAFWLIICMVAPRRLGRSAAPMPEPAPEPVPTPATPDGSMPLDQLLYSSGRPVRVIDLAALVTIALGVLWSSEQLARLVPVVQQVIWLTTIVLVLAQLPAVRALSGNMVLGNSLLLLFLTVNGAQSVVANIVAVGPAVFYFAAGTVAVHGLILFGIGAMLRVRGDVLAVASQANVGGSLSALAIAGARGYPDLLLPGVAVGMLGNALGNYAGVAAALIVRAL